MSSFWTSRTTGDWESHSRQWQWEGQSGDCSIQSTSLKTCARWGEEYEIVCEDKDHGGDIDHGEGAPLERNLRGLEDLKG
ncbi:hypothetical protein [uncultured Algoriphagus sp.]|uniref:hypothetical protein n=1 Tax=uncultured Algoriphagus sp. TaxID=417365 RepID=UPI0030EF90E8